MSKAEELAKTLEEHAEDHFEVAQGCDMRPSDTLNWKHFLTSREAASHLRALDASHRQLLEALEALVLADDAKQYNHLLKGIGTNTPIGKRWANAESAIAAAKELT